MYPRKEEDGSGDDSEEDPPVPMPNTEVKLFNVDGTWWETARESRKLPEPAFYPIKNTILVSKVVINVAYREYLYITKHLTN